MSTETKRSALAVAVFIGAGVVAGMMIGVLAFAWRTAGTGVGRSARDKISYTMRLIDQLYVDPVNADSLAEKVIPLIFEELDPHSVYIPASDLAGVNEPLEGEFDGIGVMFNMLTDTVVVVNVIPSGPSDKAGVQNGDRIIRIDDSLVAGRKIDQNAIVKRLRGPRGTSVRLGIERQGADELVPVTVERGVIPLKALDAAFMIAPGVAFVKLSAFSRLSASELHNALSTLAGQGMRSLIFDLRGNSGGYLSPAIEIANMFLPKGELIVYTEDRAGKQVREYSNGRGSLFDTKAGKTPEQLVEVNKGRANLVDIPMVMLIDEGSASSSEILAGAIQDNDRGTIVGRRSFGKGLVQREIPYPDGSAVRLTVARYYTPSGRSIQKPYDNGVSDYKAEVYRRFAEGGEVFSSAGDSLRHDSVRYFTRSGRVVYGGGGITPDHFVPIDTVGVTPYYQAVNGRNLIYRFVLDWGDRHRAEMNSVETLDDLHAMLGRYPGLVDEFTAYAARGGVARNGAQIETSRKVIDAQLRALIGRNTALDYNGFYANIFVIDSTVQKAIELLNGTENTKTN